MAGDPWLLVVDPQNIFADPNSPWGSPMWAAAEEKIFPLIDRFGERTIITRWLPPDPARGSWRAYLDDWPFADVAHTDPLLDLLPRFADAPGHRLDAQTFGKWNRDLRAITGETPHLVVSGVSTDCCVLSTVLPAADDGAYLTVVADACAGSTPENHAAALTCMGLYPPQVTVVAAAELR